MINDLPTPLSPAELASAVVQRQVGQDFAEQHAERSHPHDSLELDEHARAAHAAGQAAADLHRR